MIDNSSDVDAYLAGKQPGTELRLQVLSSGRERRVTAILATRPGQQVGAQVVDNNEIPYLMLDTGGHMAVVKGIAFTPDGSQLVTASEDKQVRVWDWRSGKTLRIIRGNVGPATEGQIYGMALSPNGRWLATGGWMSIRSASPATWRACTTSPRASSSSCSRATAASSTPWPSRPTAAG